MHTPSDYRQYISRCIKASTHLLAQEWLNRLETIVHEAARDIFPTEHYLDHIPAMIEQIGVILGSGNRDLAMVNSIISHKALELGRLRHEQKATISQLLREYDVLARILGEHQITWTSDFEGDLSIPDVLEVSEVINSVVRLVLQYTVDAFAERYMTTIQEQTDKLVSFNHFLGHEIRSPLNSAILGLDLLREEGDLGEQQLVDVERVRQSLHEVAAVIAGVEHLVAIDKPAAQDSPVSQRLPLAPVLTDLRQQLADAMATRGVTLHLDPEMGEVCLETGRLKLLLSNLLSNAIKYSDPAKAERHVWVTRSDLPDGSLELTIRDNGLGIDEDQLKRVKGLRVRAHAELDGTNGVSGDGLGLYLVDEAMRELGGQLRLESAPGEGTSAHLIFPASSSERRAD